MWCEVLKYFLLFLSAFVNCSDYCTVKVNGHILKLEEVTDIDGFSYLGNYEYFNGESITFSCYKGNNFTIAELSILTNTYKYYSSKPWLRVGTNDLPVSLYVKLTPEQNGRYIDCNVKRYNGNESITSRIYLKESFGRPASISTILDCVPNDVIYEVPVIEGLSTENILAMYYYNSTVFKILYEYKEDILIYCKKYDGKPDWRFNESKVLMQNDTAASEDPFKNTGKFVLKVNENSALIFCLSPKKTRNVCPYTEIMLVRRKKIDINDSTDSNRPPNSLVTNSSGVDKGVLVGAIVGAIFLIVVFAFTAYKILKKTPKPPAVESTINYTNLSQPNKLSENISNQQQEVQYAVPILRSIPVQNGIYANIGPNDKKTMPDDKKKDTAPIEAVNPMYAQAVPKNLRNKKLDSPQNTVTYAELALKPAVLRKPIKMHAENPYAEIAKNHDISKNNNANNDSNTEVYENFSNKDYVEPTYCELKL